MPDPVLILSAMGVAGLAAAALLLGCAWPWRAPRTGKVRAGWALGVGVGFFLGCLALGIRPHWPPREDLDRLLALVVPAVVAVEVLAALAKVPRSIVWFLRLVISAGTARVLLHGSSYITDMAGPGSSEWSSFETWLILGGLAGLVAGVWVLLSLLARRVPEPSLALSLAVTSAGAALTVMLSGYATGGQIGLPLAAALIGAIIASLVLARSSRVAEPLGVALVGLYSLLVIGRFFGELTTAHGILLLCAPVLGWLPEIPYLRRVPRWARGLARVILVGVLVSAVLVHASRKFDQSSRSPSDSGPREPSIEDYLDYGK